MADYGLKISRKGQDVDTTPDYKLAFSSDYKGLRIALEGERDLVAGYNEITITHNLGYIPFSIVTATETTDKKRTVTLPAPYFDLGVNGFYGWYEVTSTQLKVEINLMDEGFNPTGEGKLKYYLLVNEL